MRSFIRFVNPRCRETGLRLWHYLVGTPILVLLIGLAVGFGGGYFAGSKYTASYFRQHYSHSVKVFVRPHDTLPVAHVLRSVRVPDSTTINLHLYPGVGDQDGKGACAAFVTAWGASFEARLNHLVSGFPKFSPWYLYNNYGHGADNGSTVEDDIAPFMTTGTPRYSQLGKPVVQWPQPTYDDHGRLLAPEAAKGRMQVTLTNGGTGENAVEFALQTLAAGQPVQFAFPVYQPFFAAKTDVPMPTQGEEVVGGHEMAFIGDDLHHKFADGSTGLAFLGRNQWTTHWGIHGNIWFPADFVRLYTWDMTSMAASRLTASAVPPKALRQAPKPVHAGNHSASGQGPTFAPPPIPKTPTAEHGGYWLKKSAPYASIVNAAGKRYAVWPLGIMALMETESNLNPYAVRCVSYYDCSAGVAQVAVPTARQYGVQGTTDQVLNWEKVPSNDIWLAARVLHDYRAICGWPFSRLYECFNQGPFRGHYAYLQPTPGYGEQAYANFRAWLPYVLAKYS